jgi:hypothetical protein
MALRSVSEYERVVARERKTQSTWSISRPVLEVCRPAPAFLRKLSEPEVVPEAALVPQPVLVSPADVVPQATMVPQAALREEGPRVAV